MRTHGNSASESAVLHLQTSVDKPTERSGSVDIAFFLPNLEAGGAERAIIALANSLASRGMVISLVLSDATGPFLAEVSPLVHVENLSNIEPAGKITAVFRLANYLKANRPHTVMSALDLPNVQLVAAAQLARYKGLVAIAQRATIGPVYHRSGLVRKAVYFTAMRLTYPRADIVICNSSSAADEVCIKFGMNRDRVVVIHNSVDSERINHLACAELTDPWLARQNTPLILSVGSVTHLKDRSTLIKAFALVNARRATRLAIVGASYEPEEHARIVSLIAELGLDEQIRLFGFDPNPYRWMKHADVLVSSSLTEGCPNQLLEGLALGVPIVATDCPGGTSELLEHGRWGRLVPVADSHRMADAILATLDDVDLPDGRLRAADFSPSRVTSVYQRLLMDITRRQ
jgi:glycosyltransferase involved in cell wall biosynthesis